MHLSRDLKIQDLDNLSELYLDKDLYKPIIRRFYELKELYLDPSNISDEKEMYFMYRGITLPEVKDDLEKEQLRIDLTVLDNIKVGKEFNKTHGHHHPEASPGRTFPEIYTVLKGRVLFLLQKNELELVEDVIATELNEGEWILIPPNYGHLMVNLNNGVSITLNIVSNRFVSIYETYRRLKGGAYYVTEEGLIANRNYKINCSLRFVRSKFYLNNLIENIKLNDKYIKALNRPYIIRDYSEFYEETTEKKFPLLA